MTLLLREGNWPQPTLVMQAAGVCGVRHGASNHAHSAAHQIFDFLSRFPGLNPNAGSVFDAAGVGTFKLLDLTAPCHSGTWVGGTAAEEAMSGLSLLPKGPVLWHRSHIIFFRIGGDGTTNSPYGTMNYAKKDQLFDQDTLEAAYEN